MRAPLFYCALCVLPLVAPSAGSAAEEELAQVGVIEKVENEASIVVASAARPAYVGTPVRLKDELRTGENGRIKVVFRDDTELTLGEKASIVIDRYVYDPDNGTGETALRTARGAFRFVTGRIKALKQKSITVSTPFANLAVRGTEFWGGPIDATYGVFLLEGEVVVSNEAGSVTLSQPGQGSSLRSAEEPPGAPTIWPQAKVARAIATVTLR